jgi:hypothetical protein
MNSNLHQLRVCLAASQIRYRTLQGRNHMVLPVVMLTEGVHAGSGGPLYYPLDEINNSAPLWNGKPVVFGHPMNGATPVSVASSPHTWEGTFGKLFNSRVDGQKLRAEIWLDVALTEEKAPKVLEALRAGRNLEVSTGLFTIDEPQRGTWNGEPFTAIARDYRPDHLAILIDQPGACSWADGCGIRANTQKENTMYVEEPLGLPTINWEDPTHPVKYDIPNYSGQSGGPAPAHGEEPLRLPNWQASECYPRGAVENSQQIANLEALRPEYVPGRPGPDGEEPLSLPIYPPFPKK